MLQENMNYEYLNNYTEEDMTREGILQELQIVCATYKFWEKRNVDDVQRFKTFSLSDQSRFIKLRKEVFNNRQAFEEELEELSQVVPWPSEVVNSCIECDVCFYTMDVGGDVWENYNWMIKFVHTKYGYEWHIPRLRTHLLGWIATREVQIEERTINRVAGKISEANMQVLQYEQKVATLNQEKRFLQMVVVVLLIIAGCLCL